LKNRKFWKIIWSTYKRNS